MLRINLLLAWRNLWSNKLHSFINIVGLSIGISACVVIFLIVNYELGFNHNIKDGERIYRLYSNFSGAFKTDNRGVPAAIGAFVKDQFSGLESSTAFHTYMTDVTIPLKGDNKNFESENGIIIASPDYFRVIENYEWLAGSAENSLEKPFQVVLTRSKGEKYFGRMAPQDMIGRELVYTDSLSVMVSGIVSDLPFRTDFNFTDFISYSTIEKSWLKENRSPDWTSTNSNSQCVIKVKPGVTDADVKSLTDKISKAYKDHSKDVGWIYTSKAQPLSDIHYNAVVGTFDNGLPAAHKPTLILLIGVALLLILIASINFINLETAQSVRRAKEVGIHKVLGSTRGRLVIHFIVKSILITALAVLLSIPLAETALNYFTEFIPKEVELHLTEIPVLVFLVVVTLVVGLLAGFYPAFILSSFLPVLALKNQTSLGGRTSRTSYFRQMLIVFQFTFAQVFIAGTLILGAQIKYMLNKDLGFNRDAIVTFETPWWEQTDGNRKALRNELEQMSEIGQLSMHSSTPSSNGYNSAIVKYDNGKEKIELNVYRKFGDVNYIPLFGIKLLAGRNLIASDTVKEFIINETYSKMLGFASPVDAIGKVLNYEDHDFPIVGVVRDFNTKSLHNPVDPVILANEMNNFTSFSIRLNAVGKPAADMKASMERVEAIWKKLYPDEKFKYDFLDDTIAAFYRSEERTAKLVGTATTVAILISCLGLFGLASYTTLQRTKEIGIRKVLGASALSIVNLLSREFLILISIAFIIAVPFVYFAGDAWLSRFAYRTSIGFTIFAATGVAAVVIAFLTVSYQAFKAASENPVNALRSE